jgi:hypothetical protein
MRYWSGIVAISGLLSASLPSGAQSQIQGTTFIEGHVFNKWTGVPLSGALVRVLADEGPPRFLVHQLTDQNGFYHFERSWSISQVPISVICGTDHDAIVGASEAPIWEGAIFRRDIYLDAPRRLKRCLPRE